jgi:hypothetical protein
VQSFSEKLSTLRGSSTDPLIVDFTTFERDSKDEKRSHNDANSIQLHSSIVLRVSDTFRSSELCLYL